MLLYDILICDKFHFKNRKNKMIGGFINGTKIEIKRYWNGLDGNLVLRKAGKEKKSL